MPVTLEFMEAVEGKEKEITFNASQKCNTCDGSGAKPGSKKQTCKQCKVCILCTYLPITKTKLSI